MNKFNITTGLVYRNPIPHVFSKHAYFPWVIQLKNGELLCSLVIGEAFEAANLDTFSVRSKDQGDTWSNPLQILTDKSEGLSSNIIRLTSLPSGEIVGIVARCRRDDHPEEGLANPENIGFVPTDISLVRSTDFGHTWAETETLNPPLIGPSFEACGPIVILKDGRWLWPTSTWRGWDGFCPNGMKMVAWVSHDQGKTWPEFLDVMDGSAKQIIYWESKIVELTDGTLAAVAWAYDEGNGKDLANHYTLSHDGGKTWLTPMSTDIYGQTMALEKLPDGRLLSVYRRMDQPGLWANISHLENENWINEKEFPLWGVKEKSLSNKSDNMVQDFNELKFGAPCITILPDESIFIAFWCYEKLVSNIRWLKISVR